MKFERIRILPSLIFVLFLQISCNDHGVRNDFHEVKFYTLILSSEQYKTLKNLKSPDSANSQKLIFQFALNDDFKPVLVTYASTKGNSVILNPKDGLMLEPRTEMDNPKAMIFGDQEALIEHLDLFIKESQVNTRDFNFIFTPKKSEEYPNHLYYTIEIDNATVQNRFSTNPSPPKSAEILNTEGKL